MILSRSRRALLFAFVLTCLLAPLTQVIANAQEPAGSGNRSSTAAGPANARTEGTGALDSNEKEVDETAEYKHSSSVKKIAGMMGVSTETASVAFEWLNFGVLAAVVLFFLAKALPRVFRSRTSGIQKDLVDARTATEEAGQRLNSVENRLSKLDGQIAELRTQSEKDIAADEIRIKASVEEETRKILASADQEIASATQTAQRQLQRYAAELAIEQAARKLVISAETDRLLVQGFVERLAGGGTKDPKGGAN